MAKIETFKALIPEASWFSELLEKKDTTLKCKLEGRGGMGIGSGESHLVGPLLAELKRDARYASAEQSSLYVYEQLSIMGKQQGIWGMADVEDFCSGIIISHESTLKERESRIARYRSEVGLEGSPVVLCYRADQRINRIIDAVIAGGRPFVYDADGTIHKIFRITDIKQERELISLFSAIGNLYVADGHHRLGAAASLQRDSPQRIMSLFISISQLRISSFTRKVTPEQKISPQHLLRSLDKIFKVKKTDRNQRCIPDRLHRFGMLLDQIWYQLDLKTDFFELSQMPDVRILQDFVLEPFFGISEPKTDDRLECLPLNVFSPAPDDLGAPDAHTRSVLFTNYPISIHKLMEQAESGVALPPKSSFIEPKIPYGLILNPKVMHDHPQPIDI